MGGFVATLTLVPDHAQPVSRHDRCKLPVQGVAHRVRSESAFLKLYGFQAVDAALLPGGDFFIFLGGHREACDLVSTAPTQTSLRTAAEEGRAVAKRATAMAT